MTLDREDISNKNLTIAVIFALFFGFLGLHRFYVGKIKSGLFYLLFGGSGIVLRILQKIGVFGNYKTAFNYALLSLVVYVAVIYDIFAIYTESFTDKQDKVLLSGSKVDELIGRTEEEKMNHNLNSLIAFLLCIALSILIYLLNYFL